MVDSKEIVWGLKGDAYLSSYFLLRVPFIEIIGALEEVFGDGIVKDWWLSPVDWYVKIDIDIFKLREMGRDVNLREGCKKVDVLLKERIKKKEIPLLTIEEGVKRWMEIVKKVVDGSKCIELTETTLADRAPSFVMAWLDKNGFDLFDYLFSQIPSLQRIYYKTEDLWEGGAEWWNCKERGGKKREIGSPPSCRANPLSIADEIDKKWINE
jgi:hypothetical protein